MSNIGFLLILCGLGLSAGWIKYIKGFGYKLFMDGELNISLIKPNKATIRDRIELLTMLVAGSLAFFIGLEQTFH